MLEAGALGKRRHYSDFEKNYCVYFLLGVKKRFNSVIKAETEKKYLLNLLNIEIFLFTQQFLC